MGALAPVGGFGFIYTRYVGESGVFTQATDYALCIICGVMIRLVGRLENQVPGKGERLGTGSCLLSHSTKPVGGGSTKTPEISRVEIFRYTILGKVQG